MPYSNSIGVTPSSLVSIAKYLVNEEHTHHGDYHLTPIQFLGVDSVPEFISYAFEGFRRNLQKNAGRRPVNAGTWTIVRTPDGTNLEPEEEAAFEHITMDAVSLSGRLVGVRNWHKNKYTGAADFNLLSAAFTRWGQLVRSRDCHNVKNLRWRIDQLTEELNVIRKARGIQPIVTMIEVQRAHARERGDADVIELLARMPKAPRTTEDLRPALISLGCEISRHNEDTDSISFKMPGKKKAKKFRILKLLADVADMIVRLREVWKAAPEVGHGQPESPK